MIVYRLDCDCGHHWWQEKYSFTKLYNCAKCNSVDGMVTVLETTQDNITDEEIYEIEQEFNIEIKN